MSLLLQTPVAALSRLHRALRPGTPSPLLGATVLVTGASSGIGLVTAVQVAKAGGIPILVARGQDKLEATKRLIESQGGTAYSYPCDLSDLHAIDALTKELSEEFDHIDFVVNNAGRSIRRGARSAANVASSRTSHAGRTGRTTSPESASPIRRSPTTRNRRGRRTRRAVRL